MNLRMKLHLAMLSQFGKFLIYLLTPYTPLGIIPKQAGAELCQALDKLGLVKTALPSKKLRLSFIHTTK